jgi:NADH dehydrogenase
VCGLALGRTVERIDGAAVTLDDQTVLPAAAVLWAGGVRPAPVLAALGIPLGARGHLRVTPRLAVRGADGPLPHVYALGDAVQVTEDDGAVRPTMVRAIEAIWQATLLARRLAGGWAHDAGPAHRLRRDFFHGVSLGPRHSLVVYGRWWLDSRRFVRFRHFLRWGFYLRYRLLAALAPPAFGRTFPRRDGAPTGVGTSSASERPLHRS